MERGMPECVRVRSILILSRIGH